MKTGLEIKDHQKTIRTSDVVVVHDSEKNINWFIIFEKTNGSFKRAAEMVNYDFFVSQGSEYMQRVYEFADNHIKSIEEKAKTISDNTAE